MRNETEAIEPEIKISIVSTTVLSVFILMIYTISGPLLQYHMIEIISNKTITMASGIITMLIFYSKNSYECVQDAFGLNNYIIMSFLLPGIMFSIGYNVRREFLFKYVKYILVYGLMGTVLSFFLIYKIITAARYLSLIPIELSQLELIWFSLALNSIDFVNTNQMIEKYSSFDIKKAFSISLGECLLNISLNLALFHLVNQTKDGQLIIWDFNENYFVILIKIFSLLFFSVIIGIIIGCFSAFIFKQLIGALKLNRVQQIILLLLFGLFSYSMASIGSLNPIISTLSCAFCMSHYTFFNLSFQTKEESSLISKTLGHIGEGIIYTFIGLTLLQSVYHSFSILFVIVSLISIILSRFTVVILLSFCFRFNISLHQFLIISFTNNNRGLISICITLSIASSSNKSLLLSTIMIIILLTNIIITIILRLIIKEEIDLTFMELRQLTVYFANSNAYMNPVVSNQFDQSSIKDWIKHFWREFDNSYMKKILIRNWPEVKEEYAELVKEIHLTFTSNLKNGSRSSSIAMCEIEKLDNTSLLKKSIISFHSTTNKLRNSARDEV